MAVISPLAEPENEGQQLDASLRKLLIIALSDPKTAEMMSNKIVHSVVTISETCLDLIDFLTELWMQHPESYTTAIGVLMQVLLAFLCHSSCSLREVTYPRARKIFSTHSEVSNIMLNVFSIYIQQVLPHPGNHSLGTRVAYSPSVEVLVRALLVISSGVSAAAPDSFTRLVYLCHHPSFLAGTTKKDKIWKKARKSLKAPKFDVIEHCRAIIGRACEWFDEQKGSMSGSEKEGALYALLTLKAMTPAQSFQRLRVDQMIRVFSYQGSALPSARNTLPWLESCDSRSICSNFSFEQMIKISSSSKAARNFILSCIKQTAGRKVVFSPQPFLFDPYGHSDTSNYPIPPFDIGDGLSICGQIDGLIVMANLYLHFFLYNPMTGKKLRFPGPPNSWYLDSRGEFITLFEHSFGVGRSRFRRKLVFMESVSWLQKPYTQVFDFGSGTWSNVECEKDHFTIQQTCGTYLPTTRSIYWIARDTEESSSTDFFILCLGLESLQFKTLEIGTGVPLKNMGVLNGKLCLVMSSNENRPSYDLRVLDGEAWSIVFSLDTQFGVEVFRESRELRSVPVPVPDNALYKELDLVAILQDGKLLVLGLSKNSQDITLLVYDPRMSTSTELSTTLDPNLYGNIQAIEYNESVEGLADPLLALG